MTEALKTKTKLQPAKAGAAAAGPAVKKAGTVPGCLYNAAEIEEIFRRFKAANPAPKSELHYRNAYTLLVAVVLSAQATDSGVNRASSALFAQADTPEKMLALGEEKIGRFIKTIGLWRNKAKNIIALSQILVAKFAGSVPDTREELMTLPGVGRKTANVVLNVVFDRPTMAVDTHIFRLGNRLGLACGATPEAVEQNLLKIIPPAYLDQAHHWLILHGRYICKARKPLCEKCIIADLCKAPAKTNSIPATLAQYRAAQGL
ncbi:MAG: endonuclease III [Candidatus Tokpelaia sp.]|uniref:endonuclease III n=1 Tax=Candidatus Tokpelaia sp. TaxID=2233777 RepID=UPI00123B3909|nr:endonuclease III [Candidatus Tokpelaia sp.]KAA6204593.1 MAG: endonuclease III [Candidatus Tokpelaia sp.]KAA6204909.1 MAG: endonuclease III [Candidatus Tokpelaia sp.]KAA6405601.1 endonuclease III [Candidatus Tokpelaia sp.]